MYCTCILLSNAGETNDFCILTRFSPQQTNNQQQTEIIPQDLCYIEAQTLRHDMVIT
jgi:hypothetical protein